MPSKFKASYDVQADIPERYADLFEERQGKWILQRDAIEGIDTEGNVQRLTVANTKLRAELTTAKDKLTLFGDANPEDVHKNTQELEEARAALELAGQPNDEKINNLVETRIKGRITPLERQITKLQEENIGLAKDRDELKGTITKGTISDAIREAAAEVKVVTSAIPDIVALASNVFEIVDVDGSGKTKVLTKDGVGITPGLSPKDYFAEVGPQKPHWFAGSQGAGANGNRGGGGYVSDNPWSVEHWNLTKQGQVITEKGGTEADRLAKQAGSFVGATRPTKKVPTSA